MRLTRDETFTYQGTLDQECRCRLRIWEVPSRPPVVVFSQLPDYHGTSITNCIEWLAWEVYKQLGFPATSFVVLEHYPGATARRDDDASLPGSLDAVTFDRDPRRGLGNPRWQPVSPDAVAALLGAPLTN